MKVVEVTCGDQKIEQSIYLTGCELQQVCDLSVFVEEEEVYEERLLERSELAFFILQELATRDLHNELPVEHHTYLYRRNLRECEQLQKSARYLVDQLADQDEIELEGNNSTAWRNCMRFLVLEKRKARWLELNFYPHVYASVLSVAKSEVRQFLMRQMNTAELDAFRDPDASVLRLYDDLTYLLNGCPPDSNGVAQGSRVTIRMPEEYTDRNEWSVYLVAVHEFLHFVSLHDCGGVGMQMRASDDDGADFKEVNEAVTEILTYVIAMDHMRWRKTRLIGQHDPNLLDMAYSEYTPILCHLFSKIPLALFTDAMLNKGGYSRLSQTFDNIMGQERSLLRFGANLKRLYVSRRKK